MKGLTRSYLEYYFAKRAFYATLAGEGIVTTIESITVRGIPDGYRCSFDTEKYYAEGVAYFNSISVTICLYRIDNRETFEFRHPHTWEIYSFGHVKQIPVQKMTMFEEAVFLIGEVIRFPFDVLRSILEMTPTRAEREREMCAEQMNTILFPPGQSDEENTQAAEFYTDILGEMAAELLRGESDPEYR
jgi:hypothetical protein